MPAGHHLLAAAAAAVAGSTGEPVDGTVWYWAFAHAAWADPILADEPAAPSPNVQANAAVVG